MVVELEGDYGQLWCIATGATVHQDPVAQEQRRQAETACPEHASFCGVQTPIRALRFKHSGVKHQPIQALGVLGSLNVGGLSALQSLLKKGLQVSGLFRVRKPLANLG